MVFDGIGFKGQTLKIRRPHDYHPTPGGGGGAGTGGVGIPTDNPSTSYFYSTILLIIFKNFKMKLHKK